MIFLGTWPQAISPGKMKCRIRNRPGVWVIMDSKHWHEMKKVDLYMDRTRRVWAQGITGSKVPLEELSPYEIETQLRP